MSTKTAAMPKAKKVVDPWDEQKKLITKVIKATVNNNSALPILETVMISEGFLTVSDLENTVSIPFESDINQCIGANKFLDCLGMMKKPAIREVVTENPIPIPEHWRLGDKIYDGEELRAKERYQYYLNTEPEEVTPFPEWCSQHCDELTEDMVEQKVLTSTHVELSEGKRVIKLTPDDPDNFPMMGCMGSDDHNFNHIATFGDDEMGYLETALKFVSKDDLRPAMTGIFCGQHIAATDAHRLYWRDIEPVMQKFILPAKSLKILLSIGGSWEVYGNGGYETKDGKIVMKQPTKTEEQDPIFFYVPGEDPENFQPRAGTLEEAMAAYEQRSDWEKEHDFETWLRYDSNHKRIDPEEKVKVEVPDLSKLPEVIEIALTHTCFINDAGIMVMVRVIDARFPQYEQVIPQGEGNYYLLWDSASLRKELQGAMKFANRSTHKVNFYLNGKASVSAQDVDFGEEYSNELTGAEVQKREGFDDLAIAFNAKFLEQILSELPNDECFKMKMWAPQKAAIINDHFLVMPLMILNS